MQILIFLENLDFLGNFDFLENFDFFGKFWIFGKFWFFGKFGILENYLENLNLEKFEFEKFEFLGKFDFLEILKFWKSFFTMWLIILSVNRFHNMQTGIIDHLQFENINVMLFLFVRI